MLSTWLPILLGLCLNQAADQERIKKLIESLSDPSQEERTKALGELAATGRPALEALQQAKSNTDPEVRGLASQAIERIEWVGLEKLKKHVKEHLDESATLELSKMKALSKWFPEARIYEVAGGAQARGPAAMMGMQAPKSLFAVQKYEVGFHRLIVNGIYSSVSINALIQKGKIVLADEDAALDFAVAFMEVFSAGASQNPAALMMGGTSRLERTPEGWSLIAGGYGANVVFKTEKDGKLLEVSPTSNPYMPFGVSPGGVDRGSEERTRLEIEKLKLEVEVLKRQLDKR